MAVKKDIAQIIARQLMFSASEDEKALLRKWRSKEDANEKGYQTMRRMLKPVKSRKETADGEVPVEAFFNRTRIIQMGQRTLK
ncbi:hypothetical protein [Marinilabilia sp.]